ncbi:peroxiredoxin (alkyl hydroperoxide reductase subunit C) [Granulicatella balaenopterae]|uniref:Alkyl hydroperoxide reductase C n=2 Tax=Granulicatella balaenopterae TaxID=137733 RepID=A0A1H9I8E2_9LACT|nr:peroxiredoxin (alkyl hydroperoxide reductase subunit C) [Granulicatella balaenopterae]
MLIGTTIGNFNAKAYKQGEFIDISNEDFKGKWSVICFYPADFSPVCNSELIDLQDQYEELKGLDVEVYSCSTDTHYCHKAWHENDEEISQIKYVMIGDPAHQLARVFDVLNEEFGYAHRGTFIIDPDGVIQTMEVNAKGIGRDASVLVDKIKAAQFIRTHPGEVCPAKWKELQESIKTSIDLVGKI